MLYVTQRSVESNGVKVSGYGQPTRRVALRAQGNDGINFGQPRSSSDIDIVGVVEMDDLLGKGTGSGTDDDGEGSKNRSVPNPARVRSSCSKERRIGEMKN